MEDKEQSTMGKYCEISSCMGVVDWYLAKSFFGKAFWIFLIVSGLGMTTFQTIMGCHDYLNLSEFSTRVSKQSMENGIQFPNITVCNFNRARQSVINETGIDPKALTALFQLFPNNYDFSLAQLDPSELIEYEQSLSEFMSKNKITKHEALRLYGHTREDSIIEVTFANGIRITNIEEFFTIYGRCWRINIDKNQAVPGALAGVKMYLNPQLNEYMKDVVYCNFYQQGFAISLSYQDDKIMSDALFLEPSSAANIIMKASMNMMSSSMFSVYKKPCREDPNLKIYSSSYSVQSCVFDCYLQAMNNTCGCVMLAAILPSLSIQSCNLSTAVNCATLSRKMSPSAKQVKMMHFIYECSKICKNPCYDFITIESTMTNAKQKANNIEGVINQMLKSNYSYEYAKELAESAIFVTLFFPTSDMVLLETSETVTVMEFIGNIGGQLGLWLGISIISIIQFLFYFCIGFINGEYFCKKKTQTKLPPKIFMQVDGAPKK